MEYHAFGIISCVPSSFDRIPPVPTLFLSREGTHAKYHYLIVGVQGDFTKSLVVNPPTHLWTRELKVRQLSESP